MLARLNVPSVQRSQSYAMPSSIKGINAVRSLAFMEPEECIFCYNMIPRDFGMDVRQGYAEWANGWTGGPAKTVIPFEGMTDATDKLFVASPEGIFDVTVEGTTAPTQVVTFVASGGNAGICSYVQYVNDAGTPFLLLCDEENGYYTYDGSLDTWTKIAAGVNPGQIDGADPALFDYVMVWKNRIWFIERDSTNSWYLEPGSITGAVTQFNFGTQFREGGNLRQLVNWTLDGGDGIDDYLVAISGAGDVVIYRGHDPANVSTFENVGVWFVGKVPEGRRIASTFGGEVYVLSLYGLLRLSELLKGSAPSDPSIYATYKISPFLRAVMEQALDLFGWHIFVHPSQGLLFVNTPDRSALGIPTTSFVMYQANLAWGIVVGLNKNHTDNWQQSVYWASATDNKLFVSRGHSDGVFIDPGTDGDPKGIDWELLTSFQYLDNPVNKRVQYMRPIFRSDGVPSYLIDAQYDFDTSRISQSPVLGTLGQALWDIGVWNVDVWGGGDPNATTRVSGGNGMGRAVAVNLKGASATSTSLAAIEVIFDAGGLM